MSEVRVLLTGASRFLGGCIAAHLAARGVEEVALDPQAPPPS